MATIYIGYRPILPGRDDPTNTYTGLLGTYSNWDLMSATHVLDGMPIHNVLPGEGLYPHGLQLSRWFMGLDVAGKQLANAGITHPDIYSGRYQTWLFNGLTDVWHQESLEQGAGGYGHVYGWGGSSADTAGTGVLAPYASLGYYYYGLMGEKSGALKDSATLGHLPRYPNYLTADQGGQPSTFGAFNPYLYKGVITEKSDPLSSVFSQLGHVEYPVRTDPIHQTDNYGFEHVREWFGVPSAKAL